MEFIKSKVNDIKTEIIEDIIIIFWTETKAKRRLEPNLPIIIPREKKAVITPAINTEVLRFNWIKVADQKEKAPSAPPIKNKARPKNQKAEDLNIFTASFLSNVDSLTGTFFELGYNQKLKKAIIETLT